MKNFPKYFNTKEDYLNMLAGWPPLYLEIEPTSQQSNAAQMSDALEMLSGTAVKPVPVWPEGYDPDNPDLQSGPVQPESWIQEPDPNGTIYRLGLNPETVAMMREIVTDLDPIIMMAHEWIGMISDGNVDAIVSQATEAKETLDGLTMLVSTPEIQLIIDAATTLANKEQSEIDLRDAIDRFISACLLKRTAFLTGV